MSKIANINVFTTVHALFFKKKQNQISFARVLLRNLKIFIKYSIVPVEKFGFMEVRQLS